MCQSKMSYFQSLFGICGGSVWGVGGGGGGVGLSLRMSNGFKHLSGKAGLFFHHF